MGYYVYAYCLYGSVADLQGAGCGIKLQRTFSDTFTNKGS